MHDVGNAPRGGAQPSASPDNLADLRFARRVAHLHALGERPLGEFLAELGATHFIRTQIDTLLDRYAALDPAVVRALGADRFPATPLHLVIKGEDDPC